MKTNYHTHTFRCGHAIGDEEEMVISALNEGIEVLGFSEHVPLPHYRKHLLKGIPYTIGNFHSFGSACLSILKNGPAMRLPYSKKDIHIEKVKELKKKYKDY